MKLKRKVGSMLLICALLITMFSSTAYASTQYGNLSGNTVVGSCSISSTSGYAYTSIAVDCAVTVSASYGYVNIQTLQTGTYSGGKGDKRDCSLSYSAPSSCRSVYINAYHTAYYNGQSWSASTSSTY